MTKVYKLLIIGILILTGISSAYFFKKDNPVEEACEEIIETMTNVEVDFSYD